MATLIAWQYTYSSRSTWFAVLVGAALLVLFVALPALMFVALRRRWAASASPARRRRNAVLIGLVVVAVVASSIAGFGPIEFGTTARVATGAAAPVRDSFTRDTGIWQVGVDGDTDIEYDHGRLALAVAAPDLSVITRRHVGEATGLTVQVQVGGDRLALGDRVGVLCGAEFSNPSHLDEYAIVLEVGPHGPAAIDFASYLPSGPVTGDEIATRRITSLPANGPLTLRAECKPGRGAAVKLWINDKLAVTGGISPGFDAYNSVGLYTYSAKGNTRALFDNLVVNPTN